MVRRRDLVLLVFGAAAGSLGERVFSLVRQVDLHHSELESPRALARKICNDYLDPDCSLENPFATHEMINSAFMSLLIPASTQYNRSLSAHRQETATILITLGLALRNWILSEEHTTLQRDRLAEAFPEDKIQRFEIFLRAAAKHTTRAIHIDGAVGFLPPETITYWANRDTREHFLRYNGADESCATGEIEPLPFFRPLPRGLEI